MTIGSPQWHIVTSEYPPDVGGVSDFSFAVADALRRHGPVHVWCPRTTEAHPVQRDVVVHAIDSFSPSALRRFSRALAEFPGRRLFVQWTPQGFGFKSLNLAFAAWLAWQGRVNGTAIDLMVHEPYLRWSLAPTRLFAAAVHRLMLLLATLGAQRIWLSTTAWTAFVAPFAPRRIPVAWLPVPASCRLVQAEEQRNTQPAAHVPLVGHFGLHSPLVTTILRSALDAVLAESSVNVLLIGQGSERFRDEFLATRADAASRVQATGPLSSRDMVTTLASCDVLMQPYPDGITTRRTSTITALASGVPVVTNTGELTEPLWADTAGVTLVSGPDGRALGAATLRLLSDRDALRRRSLLSLALYERLFAVRHAEALLLASPGAGGGTAG